MAITALYKATSSEEQWSVLPCIKLPPCREQWPLLPFIKLPPWWEQCPLLLCIKLPLWWEQWSLLLCIRLPPSWKQWSILPYIKIVSMIRKYHNHKPQTTPWHRKEEPLNHYKTPGTQIKQSNQLSLPQQDDCNTRMDIK